MSIAVLFVVVLALVRSLPEALQEVRVNDLIQASQVRAAQQKDLAAIERDLAEIRLALRAERAYAAAEPRLAALKVALAERQEPEARTLEAEVDRLMAEVARALGKVVAPDPVDQAVLAALERGDIEFVTQLGPRAAGGLAEAIRRKPDVLPGSLESDPLRLLYAADPKALLALVGELREEKGFFWKRRLLRLLRLGWRLPLWSADTPPRWLGDGLLAALEPMVADPDVASDALEVLACVVASGGVSARFEAALLAELHSSDADRRAKAARAARTAALSLQGFLEHALADADPGVRAVAAELLVQNFLFQSAWLTSASDTDARVRRWLADGLSESDQGGWTERERDAVASFLADSEAEVRHEAWKIITRAKEEVQEITLPLEESFDGQPVIVQRRRRPSPVAPEVLRSLVGSPDRAVLAELAPGYPSPLCFELLEAMAGDGDPKVVNEVADALRGCAVVEDPAAALAVASKLGENGALERQDWTYLGARLVDGLDETRSGLSALTRWLLERDESDTLLKLWSQPQTPPHLALIDPGLFRAALVRAYEIKPDVASAFRLGDFANVKDELVLVASNSSHALGLRVLALQGALIGGLPDDEARGLALSLLGSAGWDTVGESSLWDALDRLEPAVANEVVTGMLRDHAVSPKLALVAVRSFEPSAPGAAEVVRLVIDRSAADPMAWDDSLQHVLSAMGRVPALQDPEWIARATRDPHLARGAFRAIGAMRDTRYLPLLAEAVAEPGDGYRLKWATEALFGYLDAEAVEPLLAAAAKVQDAEVRDACLAHLERIREYQDARERWATRRARAQTREQVVAELVELLDAPQEAVRLHAIRALATWEAVEEMPRLIALTADPSAAVVLAAKQALEKLNETREQ